MGWFSRKPIATGTFRVTGAAQVGAVVPAEITSRSPLKVRVDWTTPRVQQQITALRDDSEAEVIQQLMTTGRAEHTAGDADAVGIALSDPSASDTIAHQLAAALGTPITVDVNEGGVNKHITVGGGDHLSSADAAELQRTGIAATATVRGATRVEIPQAMLPSPEASLWDLDLAVSRADGTTYDAQTRIAFRTEARRQVLGVPGLRIPVRIDPDDDARVAVDSTTYDAQHPEAPAR